LKRPTQLRVIGTGRFVLRPWTLADIDPLHALWTAPEVRRYLWDDIVITRDVADQLVRSHLAATARDGIGFWALLVPPRDASLESTLESPIAGFCGFRYLDEGPDIELLYGLRGAYWGNGFATEACLAIIDYLWQSTRFNCVYARTDPPNEKSLQVMRRLGLTREPTGASVITYALRRPA
jgi:[ribosomal protein S5]-alanine N-acetyltransferase